jgi:ABC-type glutathione transport system ATPase component
MTPETFRPADDGNETGEPDPLLEVRSLSKEFRVRGGGSTVAVDDVSFELERGGSIGLVGESGSGKTTIAGMIVGLTPPTKGQIILHGQDATKRPRRRAERKARARYVQMVFQDPYSSLDRSQTIGGCLEEVLRAHFTISSAERSKRAENLADLVGLSSKQLEALPRNLSGGQRQRAAIARALAAEPDLLVLDEAVASLDVSIQAQILNLLAEIREETHTSYLFISHDLAVVRHLCERTVVLYLGKIVEHGTTAELLDNPQHEYTQRLRASVPGPGWKP